MLFEKRYLIGNNFFKKKFFREDSRILSDNLKLTFQNLRPISSPQGFEKENRNQFWKTIILQLWPSISKGANEVQIR